MKVFAVNHMVNEEGKLYTINEVIGVFDSLAKADEILEEVKKGVEEKTSPYFTDDEYGWLDAVLDEDIWWYGKDGKQRTITFWWENYDTHKVCYSHFEILEYEVK